MFRTWLVCLVASSLMVMLLAGACGGNGDGAAISSTTTTSTSTTAASSTTTVASTTTTTLAPDPRERRPYGVSTSQHRFTDDSRSTPASATTEELSERTIEVQLYLPDTPEPVPLVVFSHGMAGHPRKFTALHIAWAEAGYAVAAPAFPLSNADIEGAFGNSHDVENQPADVVFVLDQLLALSADETSELAGRFDPAALGAAGLSAGGFTTYATSVNDETRDRRFDAAVVMSGILPEEASFVAPEDVPVLIFQGDLDPLITVAAAQAAYDALRPDRYFVVLLGGGHAGPYEDADESFEAKVPGQDELIHGATIAFWDQHLLGIPSAGDELLVISDQPDIASLQYDVS
jgi:dienelactone hydrolase